MAKVVYYHKTTNLIASVENPKQTENLRNGLELMMTKTITRFMSNYLWLAIDR